MPHKKSVKRKTHRRKHRGGYYGASGAIAPGAMQWSAGSEMGGWASDISSRGGNGVQYGRGRGRKGKGKRSTRRKHRGGGKFGGVSASFQGAGERGLANHVGVNVRGPPLGAAAEGAFNNYGSQPGSGHSSFVQN